MRRLRLPALLALAAAGCVMDGPPAERAGEAFVPRVVEQFSAEAGRPTGEVSVAGTPARFELPVPAGAEVASAKVEEDGWRSARPVRDEPTPSDERITLASGSDDVPPAPAPDGPTDVVEAPAVELLPAGKPIDLGMALALVAGQNPEVNFARAQVREAYARLNRAELMWVPDLQAGANYHRHDGTLQNIEGRIVDVNRSSLNAGLGAGAIAAGTTTSPGLVINFHAADAIFGPEIARRSAWASRHAADAEINDQLLNVALAYLELIEAVQRATIARQTLENAEDLAEVTALFAQTGQGLRADADRARSELAVRRNETHRGEEEVAVASARLAALVRLNPTERLCPVEAVALPIALVDASCEPRDLVADALGRRPELREQRALVSAAVERLRRERYAPLVPSVLVGASYSGFGGGIGDRVGNFNDRADFDALALWQVRNLGWGERAARNEASARIDQARFRQLRTMDEIAMEVVEAHAQVAARGPQVAIAEEGARAALSSFDLNRQRIRDGQGLPIEALQAVQALDAARREYLRAVMDYNEAQFRLHRALGWPVRG